MQQHVTVIPIVCQAAILWGIGTTAAKGQQDIRAEVQHALATPYTSSNREQVMYEMQFDVRLTNRSEESINIPKPEIGRRDATRIVVLGVDFKSSGGSWANVLMSSFMDAGTLKYDPCISLPPGGTAVIGDAPGVLIMTKDRAGDMGSEPILRFYLMSCCRRPDGKVVTKTVPTEPFSLHLPVQTR